MFNLLVSVNDQNVGVELMPCENVDVCKKVFMKRLLLLLLLLFTCVACTSPGEHIPEGTFRYEGAGLSVTPPENWLMTKLPGNEFVTMFTDIDYGIKPNIQLEYMRGEGDHRNVLKTYLEEKKHVYPDYTIKREEILLRDGQVNIAKIMAKRVNVEKIPVTHFTYLLPDKDDVYILSATCAEPGVKKYETLFDTVIRSAKIHR